MLGRVNSRASVRIITDLLDYLEIKAPEFFFHKKPNYRISDNSWIKAINYDNDQDLSFLEEDGVYRFIANIENGYLQYDIFPANLQIDSSCNSVQYVYPNYIDNKEDYCDIYFIDKFSKTYRDIVLNGPSSQEDFKLILGILIKYDALRLFEVKNRKRYINDFEVNSDTKIFINFVGNHFSVTTGTKSDVKHAHHVYYGDLPIHTTRHLRTVYYRLLENFNSMKEFRISR